jgi:hypothetical protein
MRARGNEKEKEKQCFTYAVLSQPHFRLLLVLEFNRFVVLVCLKDASTRES